MTPWSQRGDSSIGRRAGRLVLTAMDPLLPRAAASSSGPLYGQARSRETLEMPCVLDRMSRRTGLTFAPRTCRGPPYLDNGGGDPRTKNRAGMADVKVLNVRFSRTSVLISRTVEYALRAVVH